MIRLRLHTLKLFNFGVKKLKPSFLNFRPLSHSASVYLDQDEVDHMKSSTDLKKSYATTSSRYHMIPNTIRELIDQQAEDNPKRLLYGFPHQGLNLTFSDVKERANLLAQNLLELGFKKGDRLAMSLPNTHELVIAFLAASELGLISVLLNPAYQLTEFEYMLKKSRAKGLLIYDSFKTLQHLELMKKLCPELELSQSGELKSENFPELKHIFVLNSPLIPKKSTYKGTWEFSKMLETRLRNEKHELPYLDIDDPALILFTVNIKIN
jgi:acyl-CoA synthetase (AMP-forming)/AMP-acid ligase II